MLFFFSFENHVVYFAFKYPLVHTSLMFCYINTEVSEKEKNTNVVSDFPEIFKAEISDFPEILYIMVLSHPSLILWLSAISDDFLSLILFAVEAEYFIDEACILKIHDMWRHHFERFQLFVVERKYLHDADHLGAGIIAAEACHFYQVELVVVEACFLYLII